MAQANLKAEIAALRATIDDLERRVVAGDAVAALASALPVLPNGGDCIAQLRNSIAWFDHIQESIKSIGERPGLKCVEVRMSTQAIALLKMAWSEMSSERRGGRTALPTNIEGARVLQIVGSPSAPCELVVVSTMPVHPPKMSPVMPAQNTARPRSPARSKKAAQKQ